MDAYVKKIYESRQKVQTSNTRVTQPVNVSKQTVTPKTRSIIEVRILLVRI